MDKITSSLPGYIFSLSLYFIFTLSYEQKKLYDTIQIIQTNSFKEILFKQTPRFINSIVNTSENKQRKKLQSPKKGFAVFELKNI